MFFHKTPWFVKALYPQLTWSIDTVDKIIYLTFDDGPIPNLTEYIVKTLDDFKAKATFFCVGDNLRKYPEIALHTYQQGHTIGNHTFNHIKGWSNTTKAYMDNVALCDQQLVDYPAKKALFRPPYGKIKREQIRSVKPSHKIIMWDVLSRDYSNKISPEQCLNNSIKATMPGSIVLFHDNNKANKNVRYVLPRYLEHFSEKGFQFHAL